MLLTNRFNFFDKNGYNHSPTRTRSITVEVIQPTTNQGGGAELRAYAGDNGSIVYVEIISQGSGYDNTAYIRFSNLDGTKIWNTSPSDITLGINGEIQSFVIPTSNENIGFIYPTEYYLSQKFLEPVSTGLIATDHIFLLEEVNDVNGQKDYVFPRVEEYGPFVISEYSSNGTSAAIKIETISVAGIIYAGNLNIITGISPATIASLQIGMFVIGTGIPANTQITEINTTYNLITLTNDSTITGAASLTAYYPHNIRVGNTIRVYDTVSTSAIDGEHVVTAITPTHIAFSSGSNVPLTVTSTLRYNVIPVFEATFESGGDPEFFLFDVNYNEDYPSIVKQSSIFFTLTNASIAATPDAIPTTGNGEYIRTVNGRLQKEALQINIGLQAEAEGVYTSALAISDITFPTKRTFLTILYDGEVVAEDERLGLLLENFGRDVTEDQELILRDSDVNEALPDWILLNKKRKEMLLQGEEIWPYVGSYKGLVNIINWFGYYDIRIKEYWLNVNQEDEYFGKYRQMQVPFQLRDKGKNSEAITLLPSIHYKKTNLFGLFYDIVRDSDNIDSFGIPETEDAFAFTNEEVLVKLFALKRYLKNKFLPLNTRIVDITGEGVYYERYAVNSWSDTTQKIKIDLTREIDFTVNNRSLQIVDIRPFDATSNLTSPPYFDTISEYTTRYDIIKALITNPGGPYFGVIPSVAFTGQSEQSARGVVKMRASASGAIAPLTFTGTGYQAGDIITLAGGVYENPIRIVVNTVGINGDVQNFAILAGPNQGSNYASFPPTFYQASVVRPSGSQYITPSATGFTVAPTDIPFEAESIVLYDLGLKYSTLPTVAFTPAIGGIAATVDKIEYPASPVIYFNDGAKLEPYVDSPNIPVGAPLELSTSFDISWDEVPYRWIDLGGNSDATFKAWIDPLPAGTGEVKAIEIISQGDGYRYPPFLSISGGDGFGAAGTTNLLNGKIKILTYTVFSVSNSIGTGDLLVLSPTLPVGGINAVTTGKIVKGPGIPDGTIINIVNQPFSEIYLTDINGNGITTTINPGDTIEIHQGVSVTANGGNYSSLPNVAPNGGHVGTLYTWDELGRGDFYQMEWRVTLTEPQDPTKVFSYQSGISTIDNLINHSVILPFVGKYTAELVIYDTDNNFINEIKPNWVEAFLPEATFSYATRYISGCDIAWDDFYQEPIPEFEPTPNQLTPIMPPGIRYSWENANGRWVNPTFNDTVWDELQFNWDSVEIGTMSQLNNYNFAPVIDFEILQVSAEDNIEGPVISYTDTTTTPASPTPRITILNQRSFPEIEPIINPNDWIYIRRGDSIFQLEVLASDYTNPGFTIIDLVTTPPNAFKNSPTTWTVLREIAGTIVASGNQIYDPITNANGIKIGEWIRVFGADDVPKRRRVAIGGKDNYVGNPNYITLPGGGTDSIYYKGGEIGQIYKYRNNAINNGNLLWQTTWEIEPIQSIDPYATDYLGKIYILDSLCTPANPTAEIRPGFTVIKLNVELSGSLIYEQRLRTTNVFFDSSTAGHPWDIWSTVGVHVINVATIDGGSLSGLVAQLNTWAGAGATIWLEYEYENFPVRTYLGSNNAGTAEIYMDFNMYPASGEFTNSILADFTLADDGWFYDHGTVTGDYTIYVTNVGTWRNGLGTIITVDDTNFELYRTSTSYRISQRSFDEDYAEKYLGALVQNWENYPNISWTEACYHTWDTLDFQSSCHCYFKITNLSQSGAIQFNNDPQFIFQNIVGGMSNAEIWAQALWELKNTDSPGLSRFDYNVYSANDIEYVFGKIDTYTYSDQFYDIAVNPFVANDVAISESTGAGLTVATVTPTTIQFGSAIPKKLSFVGNIVNGSSLITGVQGLLDTELYVSEIITGTGLPVWPATAAQVLEFVAAGGHIRQIRLSEPATTTANNVQFSIEWWSQDNLVPILRLAETGIFEINAWAKTPSVDQLGWLLGQNGVTFEDPLNKTNISICHTYPMRNVANQFGYGIGKVGGFLNGINDFLIANRFYQLYQYNGINPLSLPGGWYPAAQLPPIYQYLENDPLPAPPAFDNVEVAEVDSNRLPYEIGVGGSMRWEDTRAGTRQTRIPAGCSVLLSADASKIAGKTNYYWRIYENDKILVEIVDSSILWTFAYQGKFTIELEIEDTNGNKKTLKKPDFIEIYEQ